MQPLLFLGRAALGAGLLAWVLGRAETRSALAELFGSPLLLLGLGACSLGGMPFEALRLRRLFRARGLELRFVNGCRVVALGAFFNFWIPGGVGGDAMKLYYLAQGNRGRRVEVATLLGLDRVVAAVSLLLVVLLMAVVQRELVAAEPVLRSLVGAVLVLWVGVFAAFAVAFWGGLGPLLERLPRSSYLARAHAAVHAFRHEKRALCTAFAISLPGHALLLAIFALAATRVFPADAPPLTLVWMLSLLGLFANALPTAPGGLGVGESAFDGLFRLAGYPTGAPLILAWRLANLPLFTAGAVLYVLGRRQGAVFARVLDPRGAGEGSAPEPPGPASPHPPHGLASPSAAEREIR